MFKIHYSNLIQNGTRSVFGNLRDIDIFLRQMNGRQTNKLYINDFTSPFEVENILFHLRNDEISSPVDILVTKSFIDQSIIELCKYAQKLQVAVWIFFGTLSDCPMPIRECTFYFMFIKENTPVYFLNNYPLNKMVKNDMYINSLRVNELL